MKKISLKLHTKITLLIVIVVFISISIITTFITHWITKNVQTKVETNILNIAQLVAQSPNIKEALLVKDPQKTIQPYITTLLQSVDQVEFIIVADMEGIRYSHPNSQRIGERFVGGDEIRVIKHGETYISEATGTLGKSLRAFTPVYHPGNHQQIGFVSVGTLYSSIDKAKRESILYLILFAYLALLVGTLGAFLLSRNIKQTLLGLEPDEITKLYNEKAGMLDAIHEGIIAIDENCNITLINDSALSILQIKEKYRENEIIGKNVMDVFPTSRLVNVLESGIAEYDKEQVINSTIIMTNRVPIRNNGKIAGAIATFRDKTEVTRLAEEVTGVKQIVEALRANTHEFMNKLHVILGLIHLGELDEAKKFIVTITESQQQILSMIVNKIKDPTIAGLILGKFSRAKELGIDLKINKTSKLQLENQNISSHVLVTIIGNLIENAMESVGKCNKEEKIVNVRIEELDNRIEIEVEDFGIGIEQKNLKKIFERGFTTKAGSEGVGLSLVRKTVANLNGEINVSSEINKGSIFTVVLPKEDLK